MGFFSEFKEFATKGNVVDLAVGVIIGAAFGKVVSSLVADVITPPLGLLVGGVDFTGLELVLKSATESAPAVSLRYGNFLQTVFDFLIVAFAIFTVIRFMNRIRRAKEKAEETAPPAPPAEVALLSEIRDLLKESNGGVR